MSNHDAPADRSFIEFLWGNEGSLPSKLWHIACNCPGCVSCITKSTAVFLALMILSPVTAPFASFPLSALLAHKADAHAATAVTQADGRMSASTGAGSVLIEEQMKNGEITAAVRATSGDTYEDIDGVLLVYVWPGVERPNQQLVLRV